MRFQNLKKTIANLHMSDPQFFRGTSLAPLKKAYEAYPATHDGTKFCVLLPLGLGPREASSMDESTAAARKIVVLKQEKDRWTKVWPSAETALAEPAPKPVEMRPPPVMAKPALKPDDDENLIVIEEE